MPPRRARTPADRWRRRRDSGAASDAVASTHSRTPSLIETVLQQQRRRRRIEVETLAGPVARGRTSGQALVEELQRQPKARAKALGLLADASRLWALFAAERQRQADQQRLHPFVTD